jgi:hypothetical protein
MNFEQPAQPTQEKPEESPLLEARPGKIVFKYEGDAKDPEVNAVPLFAEVRQTSDGEFAVVSGRTNELKIPEGVPYENHLKSVEDNLKAHLASAPKFDRLEDANQELLKLAEMNNWEWAAANDYEGYERQWKEKKDLKENNVETDIQ